jgi:protocatechuate 3,4-dioxygenase beta subunit
MFTPVSALKLLLTAFCCLLSTSTFGLQAHFPGKETRGLTLQGRVLQNPDGQPVRKATVQLAGAPGQYSAVTDTEGRFTIIDVEAGRYVLMAEHPGLVQVGSHRVLIGLSQDTSDIVLRMQPAAVITGRITDADGDPMRDVGVTASRVGAARAGRHDSGNGSTNDLGEFRIPDLHKGRYTVVATPPRNLQAPSPSQREKPTDELVYVATYYPGTLDKDQAVAVDAQAGAETPINFSVLTSKAYRVTGALQGLTSSNFAQLMLTSSERGTEAEQQLGPDGKFDFTHLLPGSYRVQVMVANLSGTTLQPAMQVLDVNQSIEVNGQDIVDLHLHVDQGAVVRGRMRMDTAETFDWTQLIVTLLNTEMSSILRPTASRVDKDGTFELKNVPNGKYFLVVAARGQANKLRDYFTKAVLLNGQEVGDSGFTTAAGTNLEVVISAKGATIEGMVVDEKGKPVPSVTVVDVPDPERRLRPDLYQQDTTDERGHFSLRGLNPGSYTVLAFEELQESITEPEFLQSHGSQGEKVQLDEGARKSIVVKVIPATDSD